MNTICNVCRRGIGLLLLLCLLPVPWSQAQHGGGRGGGGARPGPRLGPEPRPAFRPAVPRQEFERVQHGSIRHAQAPAIRQERFFEPRHVDVDVDRGHHFWGGFIGGALVASLPIGYETLMLNGSPYYYYDGIYYQPQPTGYQEVYPPVGAAITEPPDGAVPVAAGNNVYYFAGGAFYLQQGSQFVVASPPVGATVYELPPGSVQVVVNGQIAYQFDGLYYRPTFVNGVTMYTTFVQ
ncbi:MAG: putative lipoprotein [Verrucomicrobiales bacterium]|nr:putative lipoprotein [Verrucomicrobiales bacterium]